MDTSIKTEEEEDVELTSPHKHFKNASTGGMSLTES